jgi:hypothetical protein
MGFLPIRDIRESFDGLRVAQRGLSSTAALLRLFRLHAFGMKAEQHKYFGPFNVGAKAPTYQKTVPG